MRRSIAFDLSRLYWGGVKTTPRGIERVEMSLARQLFDDPARRDVGLVPTLSHMGVVTAAEARALAIRIERHWRENQPTGGDARYAALRARLAGHPAATPAPPARAPAHLRKAGALAWHTGAMLAKAGWTGVRPAASVVPRGAVYVNTGQVLLGWPWPFRWLDNRPDVKTVMMIHDAIPVLYPEYAGPFLARRHARAIETAARHATAMLATSEASAADIRHAMRPFGRGDMPFHVVPLPVSTSLLSTGETPQPAAVDPYFVAVGVIDQRKNHRLLLQLWRDLVRSGADRVPKLVIIGARGMRAGGLLDLIARSPGLAEVVVVASGLSSPAMREIVRGARALLAPSFAEGFGLPVAEALALDVPVIASDIPAHREVGGDKALYLDPVDGLAWHGAILRCASAPLRRASSGAPAPPQTWASYVAAVLPFIEAL